MSREKLSQDIKRALVDTWLNAENGSLTEEQRTIAEQHVQRLANGMADAIDNYVAEELLRLKSALTSAGAFTGHFLPTYTAIDPENPAALSGNVSRIEEIVTIEPGEIQNYTPSSG